MNISPHHQRPTKYPWPSVASAAIVVLAVALALVIGFAVLGGSPAADDEGGDPTGMVTALHQR